MHCSWHLVGRTRDAVKYPTMSKTADHTKNDLLQYVNRAAVENPG